MPSLIIVLPPSEAKAEGGRVASPWNPDRCKIPGAAGAGIGRGRADVTAALAAARGGSAALLGVRGTHFERARRANADLRGAPTLPAWRRYSGVVWDNLDLATVPADVRRRGLGALWVVSALGGLVRGDEAMPDYRLKMGARLGSLGTLSRWWRPTVTDALTLVARRAHVVDLLPGEHRAAIDWPRLREAGITMTRIELRARSGPPGGHFAKAAKGALARHLLGALIDLGSPRDVSAAVPRALRSFRHATHEARTVT